LKLNIYFIYRILSTQADHLLTTDIVSIIHKMGYKAIAEGVETKVRKVYLERVGCDWI
jgi:EAL domain-containing protein (putative c-di-GMP-specific phosphodiesterase class I)